MGNGASVEYLVMFMFHVVSDPIYLLAFGSVDCWGTLRTVFQADLVFVRERPVFDSTLCKIPYGYRTGQMAART